MLRQPFPLLADPDRYVACPIDLAADSARRGYWIELFRNHLPKLLEEELKAVTAEGGDLNAARQRARLCREDFENFLLAVTEQPDRFGRLDTLAICYAREASLRKFHIHDPYRMAKARENNAALNLLPQVLAEIDALEGHTQITRLIEGIFAGNIFDLGATSTIELFRDRSVDFHTTLSKLKSRPWCCDDLDPLTARLTNSHPHHSAVLFVDNAGPDVVLGMIPFARELLRRGTTVILTANNTPSLNDITHAELIRIIQQIAGWDQIIARALADQRLTLIASGNDVPLIDLSRVSTDLARAAVERGVDLVVLEGMGRAIESNFNARLSCDTVKIAMLKDLDVASMVGGELYDLVVRFEPAG